MFRYSGEGFVPARIEARPLEDVSADHVSRRAPRRRASGREELDGRLAGRRSRSTRCRSRRAHTGSQAACDSSRSIPSCRVTRTTAGPSAMRVNFSDPLQFNRPVVLAAVYSPAGASAATRERLHLDAEYQRYDWRGQRRVERRRLLRSLRSDANEPQGLLSSTWGTRSTLIFDEPKRLALDLEGSRGRRPRSAARVSERRR